jgi:hypothetical protein
MAKTDFTSVLAFPCKMLKKRKIYFLGVVFKSHVLVSNWGNCEGLAVGYSSRYRIEDFHALVKLALRATASDTVFTAPLESHSATDDHALKHRLTTNSIVLAQWLKDLCQRMLSIPES